MGPIYVCVKYFWARGVRTDQRRVEGVGAGGRKPGSNARDGRSLFVDRHVDVELTHWGASRHHKLRGLSRREERRALAAGLSSLKTAAGKLCVKGLNNFRTPPAFFDPAMVTMPNSTATQYRHAHLILESASPGLRGGSHSKQGCSTDARSVGGGYGRGLIFQTSPRVPNKKNPGKTF
jgi:hypothetical protein